MRDYWVYLMASDARTLYTGVTNDLHRRVWQHKAGVGSRFVSRYALTKLVYFERTNDPRTSIAREKQLKRWPRSRKIRLIEAENLGWLDLSADWYREPV